MLQFYFDSFLKEDRWTICQVPLSSCTKVTLFRSHYVVCSKTPEVDETAHITLALLCSAKILVVWSRDACVRRNLYDHNGENLFCDCWVVEIVG